MTLDVVLGLFALALPVTLVLDYRIQKKSESIPDATYDMSYRLSDTLMNFAPFSILFFIENFWTNLLYLIPLFLYAVIIIQIACKKGWSPVGPSMVVVTYPGSVLLTIIGYFLFFHDGVMSPEATQLPDSQQAESAGMQALWPYYGYGLLLFIQLVFGLIECKKKAAANHSSGFLLALLVGFNVLPLFTQYYWWLMLAGVFLFIFIMQSVANRMELTVRGGMGFVLLYLYMMVATASIVIYAIFF